MHFTVRCQNASCGKTYRISTELAGKRAKCAVCGQEILIPEQPQTASPLSEPIVAAEFSPTLTSRPKPVRRRTTTELVGLAGVATAEVAIWTYMLWPVIFYSHVIDWQVWNDREGSHALVSWLFLLMFHAAGAALFRRLRDERSGYLILVGFVLLSSAMVFHPQPEWFRDENPNNWDYEQRNLLIHLKIKSYYFIRTVEQCVGVVCLTLGALLLPTRRDAVDPATAAVPQFHDARFKSGVFRTLLYAQMVLAACISGILVFQLSVATIYPNPKLEFEFGPEPYQRWTLLSLYLLVSWSMLILAVRTERQARREDDVEKLWTAGLFSMVGGAMHAVLIGMPAIVAGCLAVRAANRARLASGGSEAARHPPSAAGTTHATATPQARLAATRGLDRE